jgi:hypothetical protein
MTNAAPATGAPLRSLTLPAIAPVLAVWPYIGRAQSASTEVRSKVRNAFEMLNITSFLEQSPKQGAGRKYTAVSGDQTAQVDLAACCHQANSDAQEAIQVSGCSWLVPFKNPIQRLTARVLEYEGRDE